MYSNFGLCLTGAQVTGVLSSVVLAQAMDDQCPGIPILEELVFIISGQDHTILPPNRSHRLFGNFTLQADISLLFSYCILERPEEHCWPLWSKDQQTLSVHVSQK